MALKLSRLQNLHFSSNESDSEHLSDSGKEDELSLKRVVLGLMDWKVETEMDQKLLLGILEDHPTLDERRPVS